MASVEAETFAACGPDARYWDLIERDGRGTITDAEHDELLAMMAAKEAAWEAIHA